MAIVTRNRAPALRQRLWLLLFPLILAACSDNEAKGPPNASMNGAWRVINTANQSETRLELTQRNRGLTGTWYIGSYQMHVSGTIDMSNKFNLSGKFNNDTIILNAEASDGFGWFEGSRLLYDVRGDLDSELAVRGERE